MTKALLLFIALTMLLGIFAVGCGQGAEPQDSTVNQETTAEQTAAPEKTAEKPAFTELDLSLFTGGFGDSWDQILVLFKEKYPDVKVTTDFDPKNHERLRARLVAGNPPDVSLTVQSNFDLFGAIANDQYRDLEDLFDDKVEGKDITYKDLFKPESLNLGRVDGKIMLAPSDTSFLGWIYNKKLMSDNGWTVPKTWDEFMALCEKIKAKGIAPFTYQGIYPYYMIFGYINEAISAYGGEQGYKDTLLLGKQGAWNSDYAKKTIQNIADMRDKGYFLEGTTALNHTQAQMEFINGRAAFIPCGTWFEQEMKDSLPEGFEIGFMPIPIDASGKLYVGITQCYFAVPKQAKNYDAAKAWIQFIYNDVRVQEIYTEHTMLPVLKEVAPSAVEKLPKSVQDAISVATADNIGYADNIIPETFYPTLYKVIGDNLTLVVLGEITSDQFCENVEKEAERIRNDSSIRKFEVK